ncbi:MAG: hypothetical protein V4858_17975 [Pseudomonadota bacterium]
MFTSALRTCPVPLAAALFLAAGPCHAQPGPAALAKLDALRLSPESAGALVYRGETFAQKTPAGSPLFRYERRVLPTANGLHASHLTSDPGGRLVIAESSRVSTSYALQHFEVVNIQAGFSGSVAISQDGRHLEYELNKQGTQSKASEDVADPVVTGPSLFGFILHHWDQLKSGATIPVRMLVVQEKTTYGFAVKLDSLGNGQTAFTVTPSSFLVRLAIAPLRVVFDTNSKTPIRYEGRVPPMENVSGKLKDLDARVEYTPVSSTYR